VPQSHPQLLPRSSGLAILQPFRLRDFRMLWLGSVLSFVGAQLTLIAFPWLVLKVTGDALVMGTVIAVTSIPRAIFMIAGGAAIDRFSPRTVMLWVNWFRTLVMITLASLVYLEIVQTWMIFVAGFLFGTIDAFYWPASTAIIPRLLPAGLLAAGNSLIQGMGQISMMLGPAIAGLIITSFADDSSSTMSDLPGIAMIFFVDAIGFVVAALALVSIRESRGDDKAQTSAGMPLGRSVIEGFKATWQDMPVRMVTIVFTIFSLFFRGPFLVGVPVMCNVRFEQGALAFGMIGSAFGTGSLIGLLAAGSLPRPPERYYGVLTLIDVATIGASLLVYAVAPTVDWALVASALCGVTDGYLMIVLVSWLQGRVPTNILGRVMGMIMFFNQGVAPISAAIAGALIEISLEGMFLGAGTILMAFAVLGIFVPVIRHMGLTAGAPMTVAPTE
jgi:MFS family permease